MFRYKGCIRGIAHVFHDGHEQLIVYEPKHNLLYVGKKSGRLVNMQYYLSKVTIDPELDKFEFSQQSDGSFLMIANGMRKLFDPETVMIMAPHEHLMDLNK
jgi:hypothetical protein